MENQSNFCFNYINTLWKVIRWELYSAAQGPHLTLVHLHPVLMSSLRFMTCYKSNCWGTFLQNSAHNRLGSITGCFLAYKMSSSLPHRLSTIVESLSLDFAVILLCNFPDIHQDDKGNESPSPKVVWMSIRKQIKAVKEPDLQSLVIKRKTGGGGRKLTICQGQDGIQIEFSSWPLKILTFSSAHHFYTSYFHNLLNTLVNCLRHKIITAISTGKQLFNCWSC